MYKLTITGRLFYSLGIVAYGIQQIIVLDFRPQILPNFPSWAHTIIVFPILTGVAMIVAGVVVSGVINLGLDARKKVSLYLAVYFFALIFVSHIPYLLFVYPHKLSHLGSWGDLLKELAFAGASFIMAGSFLPDQRGTQSQWIDRVIKAMTPAGRIFFCTTIILFGCNHFVYEISFMVPGWLGMPGFWSYFAGAALVAAGTAILFKIFLRPVALLLALMLLLWFLLVHVPGAIAHPYAGRGNSIVSAFDALLFSGTALVLSQWNRKSNKPSQKLPTGRMRENGRATV
jgi:uncharacterized membrane protein YphA (DoxX/SURF4 family)